LSFDDERQELSPPAGSWHEVAPPTEPDAVPTPTLDPYLLSGARRESGEAEVLLALGEPWNALAAAKRARDLLDTAIRMFERAAFVAELVEGPRLSGARDTREPPLFVEHLDGGGP
jgi:hypothetical protein